MKKFTISILAFFCAVIAIDICVGNAGDYMQHHSKPSPTRQYDDLVMNDRHDILIMGSSRAHHHYVPQIFEDSLGLDVYNAGRDGYGIIHAYGTIQLITERYSPKLIIYDIEPAFDIYIHKEDINRTRYLSILKRYYRHDEISEILKDVSMETYLKSFSGLCRYNSVLVNSAKEYLKGGPVEKKGYKPIYGSMREIHKNSKKQKEFVIDSVKVDYLNKFIKCCKENGIQIVLALSPKYGVTNSTAQEIIIDIAERNNVILLNHYIEPYFETNYYLFAEPMHLNNDGATVYSKMISSEIKRIISHHTLKEI